MWYGIIFSVAWTCFHNCFLRHCCALACAAIIALSQVSCQSTWHFRVLMIWYAPASCCCSSACVGPYLYMCHDGRCEPSLPISPKCCWKYAHLLSFSADLSSIDCIVAWVIWGHQAILPAWFLVMLLGMQIGLGEPCINLVQPVHCLTRVFAFQMC